VACLGGLFILSVTVQQGWCGSWTGTVRDQSGNPLAGAAITLTRDQPSQAISAISDNAGAFRVPAVAAGHYAVAIASKGRTAHLPAPLDYPDSGDLKVCWQLSADDTVRNCAVTPATEVGVSGGEPLSSKAVAAIPLNKRDFSQLLLLAAGTMTDSNGAANFTQQFAVNGQRGTAAVFAMDSIDTTDPEVGGATFSNFNVDAIQEIRSDSGVLPASIGHGAAGFTNIITKSGTNQIHGTVFEFLRNAALDARNFFDRQTDLDSSRIPPFVRNEFGFTNGGPVVIPGVYDGRDRTYFFGQYQGFRQVLGTTQVISVPTLQERQGINTTAFPGDTLIVPVNPTMTAILNRYPLPNDPQGSYGGRTYATSSKVNTSTDQFSLRLDHKLSDKGQLFFRFNFNNVDGPTTNPSQTALDPSFAIRFEDHQRNAGLTYTRQVTPHFISDSFFGFERATPSFPTFNQTQPALHYADGLYEPFNGAAGTVTSMFGNVYQLRQNFSWVHGSHTLQAGLEFRFNRDSSYWGLGPNGDYTFSGGTVRSPVEIRSESGLHDIHVGDPLPDALSGLLTATPFSLNIAVAPPEFAQGQSMGSSAIRRQTYAFYVQDNWKIAPRLSVNLGLRYEINRPASEAAARASGTVFLDAAGNRADSGDRQAFMVNLSPFWKQGWYNFAPRAALDWRVSEHTVFHAGGAIVTILRSLANDQVVTAGAPFTVQIYGTATPTSPIPFASPVPPIYVPPAYTMDGQLVFPNGKSTDAQPNTIMDLQRFEEGIAASSPDKQVRPLLTYGEALDFHDGYIATYTAGLEHQFKEVTLGASYVGTAGVKLASVEAPNGYPGASPEYAPFTRFDSAGKVIGGFGPEWIVAPRSHSSFNSLQASLQKTSLSHGLGFQASYTFSKSLDDASSTMGAVFGTGGSTLLQTLPQDPRNWRAEKGPSSFDITHVFALNVLYDVPLDQVSMFQPIGRWFTKGWQIMNVTTATTGAPFGIYSGVQQTGAGFYNADRPDQVGQPVLSTSRTVREDYFGLGSANSSYFSIPIGVAGGTGPNLGRFGTLGRNTFRGPGFLNFDFAVIKDTPLGSRGGRELGVLEFRAEFFNIFNIVNFGLPNNIVLSQGFGQISKTAGTSRQIQFSLKLIY
jgi:hypothetical protein